MTQQPPERPPGAPPPKGRSAVATGCLAIVGILVVAGIIGALTGDDTPQSSSPAATDAPGPAGTAPPAATNKPEPQRPEADAGAQAACRHFRNVAGDADILSNDELRSKLREVNDSASVSEVDGVRIAARQVLADITSGNVDGFADHVRAMYEACQAVGQ